MQEITIWGWFFWNLNWLIPSPLGRALGTRVMLCDWFKWIDWMFLVITPGWSSWFWLILIGWCPLTTFVWCGWWKGQITSPRLVQWLSWSKSHHRSSFGWLTREGGVTDAPQCSQLCWATPLDMYKFFAGWHAFSGECSIWPRFSWAWYKGRSLGWGVDIALAAVFWTRWRNRKCAQVSRRREFHRKHVCVNSESDSCTLQLTRCMMGIKGTPKLNVRVEGTIL